MFSDILGDMIEKKGISRTELANTMGVGVSNINQRLKSESFTEATMNKFAQALDCKLVIKLIDNNPVAREGESADDAVIGGLIDRIIETADETQKASLIKILQGMADLVEAGR